MNSKNGRSLILRQQFLIRDYAISKYPGDCGGRWGNNVCRCCRDESLWKMNIGEYFQMSRTNRTVIAPRMMQNIQNGVRRATTKRIFIDRYPKTKDDMVKMTAVWAGIIRIAPKSMRKMANAAGTLIKNEILRAVS